jgi:hypothetical protein
VHAAGSASLVGNGIVSEEKHKPALDEQTLAKLLEAAYVLQEHNREVQALELGLDLKRDQIESEEKARAAASPEAPSSQVSSPASQGDYTFTLAQIVSTQHQIQLRNLDLEKTMALITERVTEIARAEGAAIGVVEGGKKVRYRAVSGSKAPAAGTEVSTEKALCLPCIRNGQVFRCVDVDPEFLIDVQECRRRGIQSLVAIPIFHEGTVAGGLEVYYSRQHGFTDQDVHTCQLLAGLVTEALAREDEITWKKSLETERAMMLEALEKLKPKLSALVDSPAAPKTPAPNSASFPAAAGYTCLKCGHQLVLGEQFCGQCGSPRNGAVRPDAPAQGAREVAKAGPSSSIPAQMAHKVEFAPVVKDPKDEHPQEFLADTLEEQLANLFASETSESAKPVEATIEKRNDERDARKQPAQPLNQSLAEALPADLESAPGASNEPDVTGEIGTIGEVTPEENEELQDDAEPGEEVALVETKAAEWSSAAAAREYLEQLASGGKQRGALARFWDSRRGDVYLAIAVILVACVIRWGIWSNHPVSATGAPGTTTAARKSPDADLSVFDRMLISLGLAEAPETPVDNGNPSIRVWVDLQTALYYCPGTDLYGKTAKGKYATQRDAQLDQYQPAYRKPCN